MFLCPTLSVITPTSTQIHWCHKLYWRLLSLILSLSQFKPSNSLLALWKHLDQQLQINLIHPKLHTPCLAHKRTRLPKTQAHLWFSLKRQPEKVLPFLIYREQDWLCLTTVFCCQWHSFCRERYSSPYRAHLRNIWNKKIPFSAPLCLLAKDPKTWLIEIFLRDKGCGLASTLKKKYFPSSHSTKKYYNVMAGCQKRHKSARILPVSFKLKSFTQKTCMH